MLNDLKHQGHRSAEEQQVNAAVVGPDLQAVQPQDERGDAENRDHAQGFFPAGRFTPGMKRSAGSPVCIADSWVGSSPARPSRLAPSVCVDCIDSDDAVSTSMLVLAEVEHQHL